MSFDAFSFRMAYHRGDDIHRSGGLHRALTAAGGSRVVSVSSGGHLISPVVF